MIAHQGSVAANRLSARCPHARCAATGIYGLSIPSLATAPAYAPVDAQRLLVHHWCSLRRAALAQPCQAGGQFNRTLAAADFVRRHYSVQRLLSLGASITRCKHSGATQGG